MSDIAAAELREVHEERLTDNRVAYPLAPFFGSEAARERYIWFKSVYPEMNHKELPPTFEQTQYCEVLVAKHAARIAQVAVKNGNTALLSYLTGLTNREVPLSEARTLMRLITEMRRDGFMSLFVGDTDNGKTNTALWLSLLYLLDQVSLGKDVVLATNITSLEWDEPELNERTVPVHTKSALEAICQEHEKVIAVLDELEIEANATTSNYEVNEHFGNILTFKSKFGLVLFPIFHRTDGFGAAPVIRNHATYFLEQIRDEQDLGEDEYRVKFYTEHDEELGFQKEQYELPVPPLQPDGDYNPDEQAEFRIDK